MTNKGGIQTWRNQCYRKFKKKKNNGSIILFWLRVHLIKMLCICRKCVVYWHSISVKQFAVVAIFYLLKIGLNIFIVIKFKFNFLRLLWSDFHQKRKMFRFRFLLVPGLILFMVFNTTFNNISAISWRSVLLVKDTGVPGENHWHTLSHNVVSHEWDSNSQR
jgi:hypothetical protein